MQPCLLNPPCHTYRNGHLMNLIIKREAPSLLRKSSITLKRIFFWEFHAFVYHMSKTWGVCNVERNAIFIKERSYHRIPFFRLTSVIMILSKKANNSTVCKCNVLPNIAYFHNLAFRLLTISIFYWQHKIYVPEIRPKHLSMDQNTSLH